MGSLGCLRCELCERQPLCQLDDGDGMLARDVREFLQEHFEGLAAFEIVDQVLERDAGAAGFSCAHSPHPVRHAPDSSRAVVRNAGSFSFVNVGRRRQL